MQRRRRYPSSRLDRHGTGYKWRMRVPDDVFELYGRRYFIVTLPDTSPSQAQKEAAKLDVQHFEVIDRLRKVPASDRAALVAGGGAKPLGKRIEALTRLDNFMTTAAPLVLDNCGPDPDDMPVPTDAERGQVALAQAEFRRTAAETRRQVQAVKRLTNKDGKGVMTLVPLYEAKAAPRNSLTVEKMKVYARRFEKICGDISPSSITPAHMRKFRDTLEKTLTPQNVARHLSSLQTMFKIAVSEGVMRDNPARDIRVFQPKQSFASMRAAKKKPLTSDDVRAIFEAMKALPEQDQWVIRLIVYHGARSGEIVQLQKADLQTQYGVTFMRLRDDDDGRSIKNAQSVRDVPLHPVCADFAAFVASREGPNVFDYPVWKHGGMSPAFQRRVHKYLRSVGALPADDRKKSLHSARHLWRDLAREIGMPLEISKAITGHSQGRDAHAGYGQGPSLKSRADWIARIDPIA